MTIDEMFESRDKLRAMIAESKLYIETAQRRITKRAAKLTEQEHCLRLVEMALEGAEANRQPGSPSIYEGREAKSMREGGREVFKNDGQDEEIASR